MRYDTDFEKVFGRGYSLVTINVIYYMPDYRHLLNEFIWQTLDKRPKYPRIEQFLGFWRREIDAVIKEIILTDLGTPEPADLRNIEQYFYLN
jgi:uncharacterized protein Usg